MTLPPLMPKKFILSCLCILFYSLSYSLVSNHAFRIRTITAGINMNQLDDTLALYNAIEFLVKAKHFFTEQGYVVQTMRVSTQNFYNYLNQYTYDEAIKSLTLLDKIATQQQISLSIGQVLPPDTHQPGIGAWSQKLIQATSNISFSLPISSHAKGIQYNSIKASSEIISAISRSNGCEDCFRFMASANCPPGQIK